MFVLLFAYVFGGAIDVPGVNYREFLIAGIFAQTVVFGATYTGAGLAEDMKKGIIDRFRSLPMTRSAVLIGRTGKRHHLQRPVDHDHGPDRPAGRMADPDELLGSRPRLRLAAPLLLRPLLGDGSNRIDGAEPEVVNNASFMVIMPLTFISNAFVPSESLPGPLAGLRRMEPGLGGDPGSQEPVRQRQSVGPCRRPGRCRTPSSTP